MARPEGTIEDYLTKVVKQHGGQVRKLKFINHAGAPDRMLLLTSVQARRLRSWFVSNNYTLLDRDCRHPLVELKAPGKKPTAQQLREHERLREAGFVVLVIDSKEQIDELFS